MKKGASKQLWFLMGAVILTIILFFILFSEYLFINQALTFENNKREKLRVVFLDIGQGDSSFIKTPAGKIILIDGGPDNLVLHRLGERMAFYERKIEAIIVSHWHDDHIVGLIEILKRYRVKHLIFAANLENSFLAKQLLEEATKRKVKIISINSFSSFNLQDQCEILLLNPLTLKVKENSNNSLIAKLNCADLSFLFSGDNEEGVEKALLQSSFDLRASIFKASHHGSKTSNKIDFLKEVNPEVVVISVGANNRFNHPASETLQNIEVLGLDVLRTDESGSLEFSANIK